VSILPEEHELPDLYPFRSDTAGRIIGRICPENSVSRSPFSFILDPDRSSGFSTKFFRDEIPAFVLAHERNATITIDISSHYSRPIYISFLNVENSPDWIRFFTIPEGVIIGPESRKSMALCIRSHSGHNGRQSSGSRLFHAEKPVKVWLHSEGSKIGKDFYLEMAGGTDRS
jgi:hypothetical protein